MSDSAAALAALVQESQRIVVFSGAGISTESGIPDFRGPGGVWETVDPNDFHIDRFLGSEAGRRRYWLRSTEMYHAILKAQPNAGHLAVTQLGAMGRLRAVITQNVDGLHQLAGTPDDEVIELHGSQRKVHCLSCGASHAREAFQPQVDADGNAPACLDCGGLMKPATISFGQMLREEDLARADAAARDCDLFLVLGSSLVVYPAAHYPRLAAEQGARLVILNAQETPHDGYADLVLRDRLGDVLPPAIAAVQPTPLPV